MEHRTPRSLPVEYAVLGLLHDAPMHGYELRQRFERGLGDLWHIATSRLYSVLHRMEERGWAHPHVEADSPRPSRTVYRITDLGEEALSAWLLEPVEHLRDMRVEFLAKVYFARRRGAGAVSTLVDRQKEVLLALEAGLAERNELESDDFGFERVAASFRRRRMQSMIEWLDESRDLLIGTEDGK